MNSDQQTRSTSPCRPVAISLLGAVLWPHTRDFLDIASALFAGSSSLRPAYRLRITTERSLWMDSFPVTTLRAGLSFRPVSRTTTRYTNACSAALN